MNYFFGNNVPIVLLLSLVFLANAQRRDVETQHELDRQNKITQQILEAYIQKKLGLSSSMPRAPSILDILPKKMPTPQTTREPEIVEDMEEEDMEQDDQDNMDDQELTEDLELREDDSLQSVESEQIDSIYNTQVADHDQAGISPHKFSLKSSVLRPHDRSSLAKHLRSQNKKRKLTTRKSHKK